MNEEDYTRKVFESHVGKTAGTPSAAERCRTGCAFMADPREVPCATCPSRDALTAARRFV